jgi:crotonobetainyl-CoA:carnitine CoA-transferase CaiB-like acyl-CoA transferase
MSEPTRGGRPVLDLHHPGPPDHRAASLHADPPARARGRQRQVRTAGPHRERLWRRFCSMFGIDPDADRLSTNSMRVEAQVRITSLIESRFAGQTAARLLAKLAEAGTPAGNVRSINEVHEGEQSGVAAHWVMVCDARGGSCLPRNSRTPSDSQHDCRFRNTPGEPCNCNPGSLNEQCGH